MARRGGVDGVQNTLQGIQRIEIPKDVLKRASIAAGKFVKAQTKNAAPKDKGNLRKAIATVVENGRNQKKAYTSIVVDPSGRYNNIFQTKQRTVIKRGRNAGQTKTTNVGYYPASQEFGWRAQKSVVKARLKSETGRVRGFKAYFKASAKAHQGKPYLRKTLANVETPTRNMELHIINRYIAEQRRRSRFR